MRFFMDTEFIEDGRTIDLISIGIVSEDNYEFYAISNEFDASKANQWVKDNVLSKLEPNESGLWMPRYSIKNLVESILTRDNKKPEIWTYYGAYDWVVFCQLWGAMIDLPKGFPMYSMDIKQYAKQLGDPKLPEQGKGEHNALADAWWNKQAWEFLRQYEQDCVVERV